MNIEEEIFQKYIPDFSKLIEYGFCKNKNKYSFEKNFYNNEFRTVIEISKSNKIVGKIYDIEANDEFLLIRLEHPQGAFVGQIKEAYEKILYDIRNKCFFEKYFIFEQSNNLADKIISKYGDRPAFMWEKFPEYGVFKNSQTGKWYGIIMNLKRSKLGEKSNDLVEIINLKLDENEIQELLKKDGFYKAWHMNKKTWITILLDGTVTDKTILALVDKSYSYTVK